MLPEGAKYGMCICRPYPGDPLTEALKVAGTKVGVIAIDLAIRRRLRFNGEAERRPDAIYVTAQQVYVNCPKYIQARVPEIGGAEPSSQTAVLDTPHARRPHPPRPTRVEVTKNRPENRRHGCHRRHADETRAHIPPACDYRCDDEMTVVVVGAGKQRGSRTAKGS